METTQRIAIADRRSLKAVSDVIRDGWFRDDDLHFDENRNTYELTIWTIDETSESLERRMLLVIQNVSKIQINRESAGLEPHPIGGIRQQSDRSLCIETYDGVSISVFVDGLKAMLEKTSDTRPRS